MLYFQSWSKSKSRTNSSCETILKVSKLSNCSRPSIDSNCIKTPSAQSIAKSLQKICCDQPIAPTAHKPLFSSIRHQSQIPLNSRPQSDHKVCIVQNFQGPPTTVNHCKGSPVHRTACSTDSKMSQDVGSCCAKYILCLFNFVFFVSIIANLLAQIQTNI